jgi:hypothetical protein
VLGRRAVSKSMSEPEEDPEVVHTRKKNKAMDEDCHRFSSLAAVLLVTLLGCLYCVYSCSEYLLIIMIASGCCCTTYPTLIFPFLFSLVFFVLSHRRTIEQALTIADDVYTFQEKYK